MRLITNLFFGPKRSSRFYKYFFSYVLIVLVLLTMISSVVYSKFIVTLQKEVESSNIMTLAHIRDLLDKRVMEMDRIALQISKNPKLTPFMVANEGFDSYQAINELVKYRLSNSFIYDIVLYYSYRDNGRMYASSGVHNMDTFFNYIYQFNNWGKSDFLDVISKLRAPVIRPLEKIKLNGTSDMGSASYIYPLPFSTDKPYGAVLFLIEEDELKSIIQNVLKDYSGFIYILDKMNQPIISESTSRMKYDKYEMLKLLMKYSGSDPIKTFEIESESFSSVTVLSDYNGWSYRIVMPTAQFMDKVYSIRQMFNYVVITVFILGLMMAFIFATGHYRPLQKLVATLNIQGKGDAVPKNVDEIAYITNTIHEVTKTNEGLAARLKSKIGMAKEQLMISLLNGKINNSDEIEDMLGISGIKLDKPNFAVLFFLIDDYCNFKKVNTKSIQDLFKFSIVNVVEELSMDLGYGYAMDLFDNSGVVLLLNLDSEFCEEKYIRDLSIKTKDFFKLHFKFTLTAGIGNIYSDISMIHTSYMEATKASYYRIIKGKEQIIFYKDVKAEEENKYQYHPEQEEFLIMAIKQGKGEELENIVKEIINDITKYSYSPEVVQFICLGIINTVVKILEEMGIKVHQCLDNDMEDLLTQQFETIDAFEIRILDFCNRACEFVKKQKESRNFELRDKIIVYIRENYSKNSLCLNKIADEFKLSPSYLSRFFKDQTGITLTKYVDMQRMNKAMDLLKNTDLTLKEILDEAGYVDETNFIRKFKKMENITPIQYRNVKKLS